LEEAEWGVQGVGVMHCNDTEVSESCVTVGFQVQFPLSEDLEGIINLYSDGFVVRGDEPSVHLHPLNET